MRSYKFALLAVLVAACVSCGGSGEGETGGSPTAPSGGGSGSGSGGGSGCQRPGAPGNLTVTVSGNNAVFTWAPVGGVLDYQLLVGSNPGTSTVMSTNTTQTSYNWNGISSGTYYVRVEARNSCGSGPASNEVSLTIG